MTPESLAQVVKNILEAANNEQINLRGQSAHDLVIREVKKTDIDIRLWYPIYLSLHWENDMSDWADNIDAWTIPAMKKIQDEFEITEKQLMDIGSICEEQ